MSALDSLGGCPPRAAKDLGRVLRRALDRARDLGSIWRIDTEPLPGLNDALARAAVTIYEPGLGDVVVMVWGRSRRRR